MNSLAVQTYHHIIETLMKDFVVFQESELTVASNQMVGTIQDSLSIYLFGSGHSSLFPQSAQLRGGGFVNVVPMLVTNLLVLENPQETAPPWQMVITASVLTTLPLILVFFFTQRYLLESITPSVSKG